MDRFLPGRHLGCRGPDAADLMTYAGRGTGIARVTLLYGPSVMDECPGLGGMVEVLL